MRVSLSSSAQIRRGRWTREPACIPATGIDTAVSIEQHEKSLLGRPRIRERNKCTTPIRARVNPSAYHELGLHECHVIVKTFTQHVFLERSLRFSNSALTRAFGQPEAQQHRAFCKVLQWAPFTLQ